MAKIELNRERLEKLITEAVQISEHKSDEEFSDSFEKWLYYTIAVEANKLKNRLLKEHIEEMEKLILE